MWWVLKSQDLSMVYIQLHLHYVFLQTLLGRVAGKECGFSYNTHEIH